MPASASDHRPILSRGALLSAFVLAVTTYGAANPPPDLITSSLALEMAGEQTPSGSATVEIVPAPDAPEGLWSLRLVFRLREHRPGDWLDTSATPTPPIDLSANRVWRLWIRSEQPAAYLHIKIVDADNPPPNHSAIETTLTSNGEALPARRWLPLDIALPENPRLRDAVRWFGFYIAASDQRVPLNRDVVFYVGRFRLERPQRPPWPPKRETTGTERWTTVWSGPLEATGPWILVQGRDNQNDHPAEFVNGGVEFDSTANGWNEFLWSDPKRLVLEPGVEYRLSFEYCVLRAPAGRTEGDPGYFYSLVRARGTIKEDVGWQKWTGPTGMRGLRFCRFVPHDKPDYYLIFGVRHKGAVRIENLRLERRVTTPEE